MRNHLISTVAIIGCLYQPLNASAPDPYAPHMPREAADRAADQVGIITAIANQTQTLRALQEELRKQNVHGAAQLYEFGYAKSQAAADILWDDRGFLTLIVRHNDVTKPSDEAETGRLWQEIGTYPGNR